MFFDGESNWNCLVLIVLRNCALSFRLLTRYDYVTIDEEILTCDQKMTISQHILPDCFTGNMPSAYSLFVSATPHVSCLTETPTRSRRRPGTRISFLFARCRPTRPRYAAAAAAPASSVLIKK